MTKTYSLPGGSGPFSSILRTLFIIGATIGGFFIFAASAAFALFVALGLLILGVIVFTILWIRAKILGRPMTPYGRMRADFENMTRQQTGAENTGDLQSDGPIIDAHETPDGWSVDSD